MTRHVLRKGFSVQEAPGGVGHLVDARTGDALVLSPAELSLVTSAGKAGLDPEGVGVSELLARLGPFLVESAGEVPHSFYELDIEDAPTGLMFPTIAPVVAPVTQPMAPVAPARASPLSVPPVAPPPSAGLKTVEMPAAESAFPSGEAELRAALTTVTELAAIPLPAPPSEPTGEQRGFPELPATEASGERPDASGQFLSQEANLRQALESQPTEQVPAELVQGLISNTALPVAPAAIAAAAKPGRSPVLLTVVGVTLLALGVAATFALRPGGEVAPPAETPQPGKPAVGAVADAGPAVVVDAGQPVPVAPAVIDAGPAAVAVAEPDAGSPVVDATPWLVAEVQGRGRVKMGEVVAPADGELTWEVTDGQRVKAKQAVATVGAQSVSAPAVGLAFFKQPSGAPVTKGAVVAEIIYFEAWARGVVKGATPTTAWRCEVASAATQQHAECKISVVAPRGNGAQVTVAIEPRWFDAATDAVLRLAPP